MLKAYQWKFHKQGGQELKADVPNHEGKFGSGDCWEPEIHALGRWEDKGEAFCISSLLLVWVEDQVLEP